MTAAGADPESRVKYAKIIGEKEKAVESVEFDFLAVFRPGVILGNSNTPGVLGYLMPLLHWGMPSKYHSIHKNDRARAMEQTMANKLFFVVTAMSRSNGLIFPKQRKANVTTSRAQRY